MSPQSLASLQAWLGSPAVTFAWKMLGPSQKEKHLDVGVLGQQCRPDPGGDTGRALQESRDQRG